MTVIEPNDSAIQQLLDKIKELEDENAKLMEYIKMHLTPPENWKC